MTPEHTHTQTHTQTHRCTHAHTDVHTHRQKIHIAAFCFCSQYGKDEIKSDHATLLFSLASNLPKSKFMEDKYTNMVFDAIV